MARYLVTGGAGFIGSHIATRLVEQGHDVRVFDNLSTGHQRNLDAIPTGFEFIPGDIRNPEALATAVEGREIVIHQAALASVPLSIEKPAEVHDVCATGTLNVLNAARKAGVRRVVYAASSSAYGDRPQMPKQESHVPQTLSPYAAAKLAGELYCESFAQCYDLETVRLRYFNVFGPRQDPNSPYSAVIPLFVTALLSGRTPKIFGDGSQSRDFVYVGNVVQANLLAATAPGASGNVYNVASGERVGVGEMLKQICDLLDVPFAPDFEPPRAGDILHSWADISATTRDLGYVPETGFEEGLRETVLAYRRHLEEEQARASSC
ncbi:SDR family oxidoreductase [Rubinisphaera margarita]|uniref:SDR family oxidoreductase n=1 Tax=Rubinisphaera margarita TaxID=2909586 RepID=UPI001EE88377|nr:SDR family oxidoreductase [Rubinisphaera margarita]MCG6156716.1 SDR family oxidoreductase [Rubinisphaera margarita]